MQSQNRLFDDLARVASGAVGALAGVRGEMEELFRQRLERYLAEAEMVPRDEFDTIKAVAVQAREAQEVLEARVADWRAVVGLAVATGVPVPALSASLAYYDSLRSAVLPSASMIQAQRDCFGAVSIHI